MEVMLLLSPAREARRAAAGVALVPFGSLEQHCGAPLGTDSIIAGALAERVCRLLAERLPCALLPVVPFGHSPEWLGSPGTVSLRLETLAGLVSDILESLHRSGFRRLVLLNAHGGNSGVLEAAAREFARRREGVTVVVADYWRAAGVRLGHCDPVEEGLLRDAGVEAECACRQYASTARGVRAIRLVADPTGVGIEGEGPRLGLDEVARSVARAVLEALEHRGGMSL